MNKFVLDTDICIYWLKGNRNIEKRFMALGKENVFTTVITKAELFYAAYKSLSKEKNLWAVNELKRKIKVLHTSEGISSIYGQIKAGLAAKGQIIDDADLLIASIVLFHRATFVTNNTKHFERIPGIMLENWI